MMNVTNGRKGALSVPIKLLIGALILSIIVVLLLQATQPTVRGIGQRVSEQLGSIFDQFAQLLTGGGGGGGG